MEIVNDGQLGGGSPIYRSFIAEPGFSIVLKMNEIAAALHIVVAATPLVSVCCHIDEQKPHV
jgi:hypothetical protein